MEEKKELLKELKGIKKIENEEQYNQMVARVELLLPLVDDDTPEDNPNRIELEMLSNLVADYSDDHFDIIGNSNVEKKVSMDKKILLDYFSETVFTLN